MTRRRHREDPATARLRSISRDRSHSATELALRALEALERGASRWQALPEAEGARRLRRMAVQWRRTQPAMGFFLEASGTLDAFAAATPVRFGPLRRWIRNERKALTRETREVLRLARRRLPARATVITISRSSLVRDALGGLPAGRRPALVLALRSRPGGEGVQLARELQERAVRAMVVEDGSLGRLTQPIQLVLVGADALLPGGDLVHKVGTRPLARWAYRRGIPVIVLAGRSKFVRAPPEALRLPSRFDRTPAAYITEVWSDDPGCTVARPGERGRRPPQKRTRP